MNGARPEFLESFDVGFAAVTFVARKTVTRIAYVQLAHQPVPVNLCYDRGAGNREAGADGFVNPLSVALFSPTRRFFKTFIFYILNPETDFGVLR